MDATKTVWVVGAGSGMGRAAAISAAAGGWRVALSGRREDALRETAAAMSGDDALVVPLDVRDPDAVVAAGRRVADGVGSVDAVVVASGANAPRRTWADQDLAEFDDIVATNLVAPARVVSAVLPELRRASGVVVLVSSYSAWTFSPLAGVAYSASKKGLGELARTLNAQEGEHGVRATHLCPGDVDTDFLLKRPHLPDAAARSVMLSPSEVADAIRFVLDAPPHMRVDELVISPVSQR